MAFVAGCEQKVTTLEGPVAVKAESAQVAPTVQYADVTAPKIAGQRALAHVKALTEMGPRPVGSAAHKKMEQYLVGKLAGAQLEDDRFEQQTPLGKFAMRNIIAKYPGTKDGVVVLASHYDTKKLPNFVGANDGGSSTAVLLAIGEQLRAHMKDGKREGFSVWLVFFDGEEALDADINASDGLYGSKHLAQKWKQDGTLNRTKAFILADMVGDQDLAVLRDANSTPWLLDLIDAAAEKLGHQSHFFQYSSGMIDDHIAFKDAGVPIADLIDFDYGFQNAFWHTPEDTADKLSPRSLEIVGNVMLQAVWMLDAHKSWIVLETRTTMR
ncbi:MAG TPA: M28 family peptidase [Terriglobales bacterium]|nr:M28 family peptidase [Terriglobales bacterium]